MCFGLDVVGGHGAIGRQRSEGARLQIAVMARVGDDVDDVCEHVGCAEPGDGFERRLSPDEVGAAQESDDDGADGFTGGGALGQGVEAHAAAFGLP